MRQVVGQIKVNLDQFGSKAHSTLKMVQNEEKQSHISDIRQK